MTPTSRPHVNLETEASQSCTQIHIRALSACGGFDVQGSKPHTAHNVCDCVHSHSCLAGHVVHRCEDAFQACSRYTPDLLPVQICGKHSSVQARDKNKQCVPLTYTYQTPAIPTLDIPQPRPLSTQPHVQDLPSSRWSLQLRLLSHPP